MPHLLAHPHVMPVSQQTPLKGFEPEMDYTAPWPSSMLRNGRAPFAPPGVHTPVTDEMRRQVPHTVYVDRVPKQGIPDITELSFSPLFSKRVVDKLEELEPGVHDFFPIEAKHVKTGKSYGTYYLAYIHQAPDIIDQERTFYGAGDEWHGPPGRGFGTGGDFGRSIDFGLREIIKNRPGNTSGPPLINFKPPGYDGLHLWRGNCGDEKWWIVRHIDQGPNAGKTSYRDLMSQHVFVSDEFAAFLKEEKIRGTKAIKILEKSPEWYFEQREKGTYW